MREPEVPMEGDELERHLARLAQVLPDTSSTLQEYVEAIRDAATKMLMATTEWDADLWWQTLRAHALVLREDFDGAGNPTPVPPHTAGEEEPEIIVTEYLPGGFTRQIPALSQAAPEMPEQVGDYVQQCQSVTRGQTFYEGKYMTREEIVCWLADRVAELERELKAKNRFISTLSDQVLDLQAAEMHEIP